MNRKQLHFLESWLKKSRRKPLMIRGARQVGKTTLVRIFAEASARPLAQINLERHTDLAALFYQNDSDALIDVLESLRNVPSINDQTLLFLDEIQATPEAIPARVALYQKLQFHETLQHVRQIHQFGIQYRCVALARL